MIETRKPVDAGRPASPETRERILVAARDVIGRKGKRGATTREIADVAGVNEATLFRHFGNKEALLVACAQHFCGYLELAGVALPAIGLVVGAIVIMNIMLVAVAERTREIGIRKSLGARRRDILAQFLVESATLSSVGALVGVGLGIVLAEVVARVSPLPAAVAPWSIALAVTIGGGVGIIAGAYPASRAARLDPILAMRSE
jgi:AcrR family transcriptional regulator